MRQAAENLHVSVTWIYKLLWSGALQAIKRNGRWFITESSIADRKQRKEPT